MTLPASALPIEAPSAFLGVSHSATGKLWRDRLDARGATRALAIAQRHQLPEMLARVLAGGGGGIEAGGGFFDPANPQIIAGSDTMDQNEIASPPVARPPPPGGKILNFGGY